MSITHDYQVALNWDGDRKGTLSSQVLSKTIEVATPPEFAKGMPDIWSPEHLFIASVSSCLMTTFLAIAENFGLEFESFSCNAVGKLEMVEGKYKMSEITLMPLLKIANDQSEEKALKVLTKAETACLITNSINSKIIFKPAVEIITIAL